MGGVVVAGGVGMVDCLASQAAMSDSEGSIDATLLAEEKEHLATQQARPISLILYARVLCRCCF